MYNFFNCKRLLILSIVFVFTVCLFGKKPDPVTVLAEYDGDQITYKDVMDEIERIPSIYQQRFKTVEAQKNILEGLLAKKLFLSKAKQMELDKNPEMIKSFDNTLKFYYKEVYLEKNVTNKVKITDKKTKTYYNNNIVKYTVKPKASILYIEVSSDSIATIVRKQLDDSVDFIDIVNNFSVNSYSKKRSGNISNIKLDKNNIYVPGVGKDIKLLDEIRGAEKDKSYGPIKTDNGIHFFKLVDVTPKIVKSFKEVEKQVEKDIYPEERSKVYKKLKEKLFEHYKLRIDSIIDTVLFVDVANSPKLSSKKVITSNVSEFNKTYKEVYEEFKKLNAQERSEIEKAKAYNYWLREKITSDVITYAACEEISKKELMKKDIVQEKFQKDLLMFAYKSMILDEIDVSKKKIEEYYKENIDKYTNNPFRDIEIFKFSKEKYAKKALKYAKKLEGKNYTEEKRLKYFNKKVNKHNLSKDDFEMKGIFRDKGFPEMGKNDELMNIVWSTKVNDYSSVFELDSETWAFVKVVNETPAMVKPFEEVESRIIPMLRREETKRMYEEVFNNLKNEYNAKSYPDRLTIKLTAEEMFAMTEDYQKRRRYEDCVNTYSLIEKSYPNSKDACKASFMKAFVLSENMNQKDRAFKLFNEFIKKYENKDIDNGLVQAAKYLIETIENPDKEELILEMKE